MTDQISLADVAKSLSASIDARGVRFEYEGRVMRAIPADVAPSYRELLASPELPGLFDAGMVRFREADLEVDGYRSRVLDADLLSPVTYPTEWPVALLKDAALVTARCMASWLVAA